MVAIRGHGVVRSMATKLKKLEKRRQWSKISSGWLSTWRRGKLK
jgi:hypothetical protein